MYGSKISSSREKNGGKRSFGDRDTAYRGHSSTVVRQNRAPYRVRATEKNFSKQFTKILSRRSNATTTERIRCIKVFLVRVQGKSMIEEEKRNL